VNRSGQALEDIVKSVKRVTDIIAEIASASQEQSQGIDQVNRAVSQMDHVVQSNAAQTEELSSTARVLASQADDLHGLVKRFKLGVLGADVAVSTTLLRQPVAPAATRAHMALGRTRRAPASRTPALSASPRNGGGVQDEGDEF
jgi:ABC-type transporter Mla subunit MlaD